MQTTIDVRVTPKVAGEPMLLKADLSGKLGVDANAIRHITVLRRSIDARQRQVMVNLSLKVYVDALPADTSLIVTVDYRPVTDGKPVVVVGAGPAGLFAALRLIELGLKPIVVERGKDVDSRRKDMAAIAREGVVNPDSNYCFGEGGAGAYS
ncbi:MAG: FAD-binding protein, partial [Duncaniella sp.]|nr:FAD-binding protein [Duncaniella sp.]